MITCVFMLFMAFTTTVANNLEVENSLLTFNEVFENSLKVDFAVEEASTIGCLVTITTTHPNGSITTEHILVIGVDCDQIIVVH